MEYHSLYPVDLAHQIFEDEVNQKTHLERINTWLSAKHFPHRVYWEPLKKSLGITVDEWDYIYNPKIEEETLEGGITSSEVNEPLTNIAQRSGINHPTKPSLGHSNPPVVFSEAVRGIQGTKAGGFAVLTVALLAFGSASFAVVKISSWAFSNASGVAQRVGGRTTTTQTLQYANSGVATQPAGIAPQHGMDCSGIIGRMVPRLGHEWGCAGGNMMGYTGATPQAQPNQQNSVAGASQGLPQPQTMTVSVSLTAPRQPITFDNPVATDIEVEAVPIIPIEPVPTLGGTTE